MLASLATLTLRTYRLRALVPITSQNHFKRWLFPTCTCEGNIVSVNIDRRYLTAILIFCSKGSTLYLPSKVAGPTVNAFEFHVVEVKIITNCMWLEKIRSKFTVCKKRRILSRYFQEVALTVDSVQLFPRPRSLFLKGNWRSEVAKLWWIIWWTRRTWRNNELCRFQCDNIGGEFCNVSGVERRRRGYMDQLMIP